MSTERQSKNRPISPEQPSLSDRHADIGFANTFRLEYIKNLITVAAGVFVFSVTFMKELMGGKIHDRFGQVILIVGWAAMAVSIFSGVIHMRYWSWYFTSWGLHPFDTNAVHWREVVSKRRRWAERLQVWAFGIGILMLFVFSALNLIYSS